MTIPEIYPGIEREAVVVGADVYQLYGVTDAIAHEYEFGGGNHMATSRTSLDWFRYQVGMRSFRAFAQGKATWILNYSWDGDARIAPPEPMMNLAMSVVMAGANFWDAATHVMSGSNDLPTRKRIFELDRKEREHALRAAHAYPSDRRVLLAIDPELLSGRVPARLPGHCHPVAADASRVPDRDSAHADGL